MPGRSRDYPKGLRYRPEAHLFLLTDILAVDLECHWPVGCQGETGLVMQGKDAGATGLAAGGCQHLAQGPDCGDRPEAAHGEQVKSGVEASLRIGLHRALAEISPGRGIGDESEEQPVLRGRGMQPAAELRSLCSLTLPGDA